MKAIISTATVLFLLASCKPFQISVPDAFAKNATDMKVRGLNGFQKRISFGTYKSSKIKTRWGLITHRAVRPAQVTPEERIAYVLGLDKRLYTENSRTRYQYSLSDDKLSSNIYCLETKSSEELLVKSHSRWLGDVRTSGSYRYSFSAVIVPRFVNDSVPWKLILFNNYDRNKDTAVHLLDPSHLEEGGYATNGKDTITIKHFYVKHYTARSGRQEDYPFKIPAGYELRINDGVVGIVDTVFEHIWLYNGLDARTGLILASISSSILLRKVNPFE